MTEDDIIATLSELDLFAGFSPAQLRLLAFVSEERALASGERLYQAGDRPDGAYVLTAGALEVDYPDAAPSSRYGIAPTALVGEMGLMLTRPRPATVTSSGDSHVIFVPREPFLKLLRGDPNLAASVSGIIRAELVRYLDQVTQLKPRLTH